MAEGRRQLRAIDDYCSNVGSGQETLPEYFRLLRAYVDSDHAAFFHADATGQIVGAYHEVPQHMPHAAEFIRRARAGTDAVQNDLSPSVAELFRCPNAVQNLSFDGHGARESALYREVLAPVGGLNVLRIGLRRQGKPAGLIALVRGRGGFRERDGERLRQAARPLARLLATQPEADDERFVSGEGFLLLPGERAVAESGPLDGDAEGLRLWSLLFDRRFLPSREPEVVLETIRQRLELGELRTGFEHGLGRFVFIAAPFEGSGRVLLRVQQHVSSRVARLHRMNDLGLSSMQKAVALGILGGRSQAEMADDHGIGVHTVVTHVRALYAKLGVTSRAELVDHFGMAR